jgi:hypothetical protein
VYLRIDVHTGRTRRVDVHTGSTLRYGYFCYARMYVISDLCAVCHRLARASVECSCVVSIKSEVCVSVKRDLL